MSDQSPAATDFNRWMFRLLKPIHRVLMLLYFRVEIVGHQRIPCGGAILAPKHSSRWDPLVLTLLSPTPLRFVATHTEFKGMQGWFMRQMGTIPVDRESAHASTFHVVESLLMAGETIVMFPEGGIRPGRLGPLKPGICRLGVRLTRKHRHPTPIVPIAITYTPAPRFRAHVRVEVLPALPLADQLSAQLPPPVGDKQLAEALTQELSRTLAEALALPKETCRSLD